MKIFVNSLGALVSIVALLLSSSASAEQFVEVYRDKINGLSWGELLSGEFGNRCPGYRDIDHYPYHICERRSERIDPCDKNKDSEAMQACLKMGARLPTKNEVEILIKNFPFKTGEHGRPFLTEDGLREARVIFKDLGRFWTCTDAHDDPVFTYTFRSDEFGLAHRINIWVKFHDFEQYGVRCVKEN